ncbi:protein-tyrosine-phosphatase [Deltaproteobacteria bacterium Smac51]|nr:protein-tyrosine-phosphatase [Deltaproteobacteria bacterium Smac51]
MPIENSLTQSWPRRLLRLVHKIPVMIKFFMAHRNPKWAMPVCLPSSDNLYTLNPRVFRSAQPTAEAFTEYEKLGLKTVLQLRPDPDDEPLIKHTGLKLIVVPMRTDDIKDEHIIMALNLIQSEPGPVLVHCRHGADRTGVVMAMYRIIIEGWTRDEAMTEMLRGGYGFHHRKRQNIVEYMKGVDIEGIRRGVKTGQ